MPRLIWTARALRDLQRLSRFLRPKDPAAAQRAVGAIRKSVKVLRQHPAIGRPIDEMPEEFREWVIDFGDSGYVARYRYDLQSVTILAIRHQREAGF